MKPRWRQHWQPIFGQSKPRLRRSQRAIRIAQQDGKFQIEGMGAWHTYWRDPYHLLLTIPWVGFLGIIGSAYVLLNVGFAGLYLLGGDCLTGARSGSFEDAFFFSVQTLASIGYGVISPKTTYANVIVTMEAISSLLAIAVVTGIAFARFARPTARVVFSRMAVVTIQNGHPCLMFRMANHRRNQIMEGQLRVYLMRDEVTQEGDFVYRIYDLPLLRDRTPGLTLSWTASHRIDEASPLFGWTAHDLVAHHAQIAVTLSGIDETVAYTITVRHTYGSQDILFNHKFMDIIYKSPNGDRYFDYTHFHRVVPVDRAALPMDPMEQTG